jgi:TolA-binding protein
MAKATITQQAYDKMRSHYEDQITSLERKISEFKVEVRKLEMQSRQEESTQRAIDSLSKLRRKAHEMYSGYLNVGHTKGTAYWEGTLDALTEAITKLGAEPESFADPEVFIARGRRV